MDIRTGKPKINIVTTPGILGGKPRIEDTRLSVQQIADHYEHAGWSAEEIQEAFHLSEAQVYAALAYYYEHQPEIDAALDDQRTRMGQVEADRRAFAQTDDVFSAVMTAAAVAEEFHVSPRTVRDAIEHGWIEAHKSGGTWLIRRADAEARWADKQNPTS